MLEFKQLKEKYKDFEQADFEVYINEKEISENKAGAFINFIEVELSSGYDASIASFQIHNCFCEYPGYFELDNIKKYIQIGSSVDIFLGYQYTVKEVFLGFITRVNFIYEDRNDPYIQVTAMDVKGIMMANSYAKVLKATSYSEAVKEILSQTAYEKLVNESIIRKLEISDTPDKKEGGQNNEQKNITIDMVSESDYEFVVRAAKRFHYEFYIHCGIVYFRKAKSEQNILLELGVETGLLELDVGYDISGLVSQIEVRAMDQGKGENVSAAKKLNNKISTGNKAKSLMSGSKRVWIDAAIISKEDAGKRAEYLAEDISYQFAALQAKLVGLPELVPGNFIKIKGLNIPMDNQFYVTKVTHRIELAGGYHTTITGCGSSIGE